MKLENVIYSGDNLTWLKKLTEKHGRALRQLLDQAEVLRDVLLK